MKVVIRADSSIVIGSGHIMRCMTLADQLVEQGAEVRFICADLLGAMFDLIEARGYLYERLDQTIDGSEADAAATKSVIQKYYPAGLDWLIVDHYQLDASWESHLRPFVSRLMVIDDLANRRHDCDLLLDQNYYRNFTERYDGLVSESAVLLLGPEYALLRPEFYRAKNEMRPRNGKVNRILVFFGGSDPSHQTECALQAIERLDRPGLQVDVVVGSSNPNQQAIREYCDARNGVNYHCQVSNMAEFIAAADLAIGAGGATTWERCILGLPCLTVVLADNQLVAAEDVAATGATICLGWALDKSIDRYFDAISAVIDDQEQLKKMSDASRALVDVHEGAVSSRMVEMGLPV